ncbi:MAG: NfeD family protein [Deltaproteobacteria bacterium]|nr:NfeD family protein [Deltaproteobacteria bacterium]
MLPIYLGTLVFGGLLVAVSLLFGGENADVDADADADFDLDADTDVDLDLDADADVDLDLDADADVDLDLDADADVDLDVDHDSSIADLVHHGVEGTHDAMWLPFLSLRFWTFSMASFGLMGVLLTLILGQVIATLPIALVTGVSIGTFAAWFFRRLKHDTVTADTGLRQYIGAEARVLLPIRPGQTGKIVIDTLAGQVELHAVTGDAEEIPRGGRVLVAHIEGDKADVTNLAVPGSRPPQARERTRE